MDFVYSVFPLCFVYDNECQRVNFTFGGVEVKNFSCRRLRVKNEKNGRFSPEICPSAFDMISSH